MNNPLLRNIMMAVIMGSSIPAVLLLLELPEVLITNTISSLVLAALATMLYLLLSKSNNKPLVILFSFTLLFHSMGLLPLSNRRDYIDFSYWWIALALALASLWAGGRYGELRSKRRNEINIYDVRKKNIVIILAISALSALYIASTHGLLIFHPELRFGVSSTYLYLIEGSLVAGIVLFTSNKTPSLQKKALIGCSIILLLLSTGYRNQAVLFLLGIGLIYFFTSNRTPKTTLIYTGFVLMFSLLAISFYLRIENSEDILNWSSKIIEQEIFAPSVILPILPIHDSAREVMGVAEVALNRKEHIKYFTSLTNLFFLDMWTLIPGRTLTGTSILGVVVGNSDSMYLVPGSLGALLISFGYLGVVTLYFSCGYLVSYLWATYKSSQQPIHLSSIVIFIIYFIQFTYRGFPKPMYLFAALLLVSCFKIQRKRANFQ